MNAPYSPPGRRRIAVVGSGISGLSAAWLLSRAAHEVVLFEADGRLGGHSNTVEVALEGRRHPVDTGFLVFNEATYPNLIAMFDWLNVASVPTEMSFAVSLDEPDLEWAGSSLSTVFGQRRNLVRAGFWRMLGDILRFNRETTAWLASPGESQDIDLREFLRRGSYSEEFAHWYLLPMAGAIWSCPAMQMLDYPLATFVRFCRNHGLLQIFDRPQWRTVQGGARIYVERLAREVAHVRRGVRVEGVLRNPDHVILRTGEGIEVFDEVVFATHADQTLRILGEAATEAEKRVLGAIPYQRNRALLHTDAALLPRNRRLWSAWNYLGGRAAQAQGPDAPVAVSYLINRLQPLPFATPVVVTLNPQREPDPARVLGEFDYEHPVFDRRGIAAQQELPALQGLNRSWFAGAWTGYGFHEDGLKSGIAVARALGAVLPWLVEPLFDSRVGAAAVPVREYA